MNSTVITISLEQLFFFVLGMISIGILVLLAILLFKIKDILDQMKNIIIKNEKHIDQTIETIPKVLQNIEEISDVVSEETKNLQGVVKNIEQTVEYTQEIGQDILEPIGELFQVLSLVTSVLPKKKKKTWFNK
ncbi:MAG: hypothetical protein GX214_03625 [Clostridiales bacterium]|nr:hypothetical protein [Clostridiales bacterium]